MLEVLDRAGYHAVLYADTFDQGFDFYCVALDVQSPELVDFLPAQSRLRAALARR